MAKRAPGHSGPSPDYSSSGCRAVLGLQCTLAWGDITTHPEQLPLPRVSPDHTSLCLESEHKGQQGAKSMQVFVCSCAMLQPAPITLATPRSTPPQSASKCVGKCQYHWLLSISEHRIQGIGHNMRCHALTSPVTKRPMH